MRRKLISIFLILWIWLAVPMAAYAQTFEPDRMGSVSVTLVDRDSKTPIVGAELSVYYVATVGLNSEDHLSYTFTDEFKDCGCALEDPELPAKLEAFIQEHAASAEKLVTDGQGSVVFTNLPLGLYFVRQTNTVAGYAPCRSFLVTIPSFDGKGYVYDVNASPKTDVIKLTDITIKKVWNTDAISKAVDSVTVQLLREGAVVETATLSDQNNWQIVYKDMPESDGYSIVEINVPEGFTATYSQSGYVFTVTNSSTLIETGQMIWPIPVLAMAGLCLIAVGAVVLEKTRKDHG